MKRQAASRPRASRSASSRIGSRSSEMPYSNLGPDEILEALATLSRRVAASIDIPSLAEEVLEVTLALVGAEAGSILVADTAAGELVFQHAVGPRAEAVLGRRIPENAGLAGQAFSSGEEIFTVDAASEPEHLREFAEMLHYAARDMAALPICIPGGQRVGVLQIMNSASGDLRGALPLLRAIVSVAALLIETRKAEQATRLVTLANSLAQAHINVQYMTDPVLHALDTIEHSLVAHQAALDRLAQASATDDEAVRESLRDAAEETLGRLLRTTASARRGALRIRQRCQQIAWCVEGAWFRPQLEEHDVGELARVAAEALASLAQALGVGLEVYERASVVAQVDGPQLFNAIYNLLHNGLVHTPRGGRAWVSVERAEPGHYAVEVGDTGPGISKRLRDRIFGEGISPTGSNGPHIGTSMVAGVVRAHFGSIVVDENLESGTLVRIVMPLNPHPVE